MRKLLVIAADLALRDVAESSLDMGNTPNAIVSSGPTIVAERLRAVIADDEAVMLNKVADLLVDAEIDVVAKSGDGKCAIDAVERLHPDIIILDVSMPVMNGIDAARYLSAKDQSAKIIFLSVYRPHEVVEAAMKAGACGYVVKARIRTDLLRAVRESLAGGCFVSPD